MDSEERTRPESGQSESLDGPELYVVVRKAVADAIRDVLRDVATAVVGTGLVVAGVLLAVGGLGTPGANGWTRVVAGLVVALGGVASLAARFEFWPFARFR